MKTFLIPLGRPLRAATLLALFLLLAFHGVLVSADLTPGPTDLFGIDGESEADTSDENDPDSNTLTPIENWRQTWFGTTSNSGDAADTADPDGDGIANLLEYWLGSNPLTRSPAALPAIGLTSVSGQQYLTLTFTHSLAATDVTGDVEISGDLSSWNQGSSYSPARGDVPSNSYTTQVSRTTNGATETIVVRANVPISPQAQQQFLRLRVTPNTPSVTASTATLAANATSIEITGTGFDATAAHNTVSLSNGAIGTVTAATATSLTVTFTRPPTSAGSLTVAVITDGVSSGSPVQIATVVHALSVYALSEGPGAHTDSVILSVGPSTTWTAITNTPSWLSVSAGSSSGTGGANIVFAFAANTGATRTGTLTIAGQTFTVTQAGSTYVASNLMATLPIPGLSNPFGLAADDAGNVYVSDTTNTVTHWTAATQTVSTLSIPGLGFPEGLAVDGAGNVYIADADFNAILKWTPATQTVSTLDTSAAPLQSPFGVAVDSAGNVYIADTIHSRIKKWTVATQTVSTLPITGLSIPFGVAVDSAGNVYIADTFNNVIKKWTVATQAVSTLDTGAAPLLRPEGVAVDRSGNVYIADSGNNAVKKWTAATQTVSTLPLTGLFQPFGVAVNGTGDVFANDSSSGAVHQLLRAYVDPTAKSETAEAGSDVLPPVLPTTESLVGLFAPVSDQSWLTIGSVSGGVVNFSFTLNTTGSSRTAHIALLGQSVTVTQAAQAAQTGMAAWRLTYFGTTSTAGNLADDASYTGDGIANLLKYALGLNPTIAASHSVLPGIVSGSSNALLDDRLAIEFAIPIPAPSDVTYTVQATADLLTWTTVATKTGTGVWTWNPGGVSHIVENDVSNIANMQVGDLVPSSGNPHRFMRLLVSHGTPTGMAAWRLTYFGTISTAGNLADDASYAGDGIANLLKYALGLNPTIATSHSVLPGIVSGSSDALLTDRLAIEFTIPIPAPSDVTYTVQATADLLTWTTVATKTGTGAWTWSPGGVSHIVESDVSSTANMQVGDLVPSSGNPHRFMRLLVSGP